MKIRSIIVEDESHSIERLKFLLKDLKNIQIIGEAQDGKAAIELINNLKPELIFLDIQLPGTSGFGVLEKISYPVMVIFVTSYDQYAIKAFEKNAVDYILKPTSKERLKKAVERVINLNKRLDENTIEVLKSMFEKSSYMTRFAVKLGDEILIIPQEDVYYFNAEDKYVFLHTYDRKFFYDATLKELEDILDPEIFCRIHKSYIVSINKIKKLKKEFFSEYSAVLDDNKTILKVGRNFLPKLRKNLKF